ncbi:thioredoxin domain-containing protein [Mycolicibacterium sp.]|uniref:thioredoxin domain-containing protein n=1 Tax=Mycolicibacterium sp. TaxID=2320850 RepID=UPI0025E496DF|nr:thioredoxin domain-containing protein [Mycolicibacterium sp.]
MPQTATPKNTPVSPAGNALAAATSPYLRQHADNPVHWQQWSPEALAEAARRDVPILLSIGYAACHWCHVMAHESFEDPSVAAVMNEFVCIKVDREERPDLDAVYMNATVALTGHGGWPMTCFVTPDGRPFFCGTYYPKPQFLQLLGAVAETWRERRDEVEQASDRIAGELRRMASGLPGGGMEVQPALCDQAVESVLHDEDTTRGGFGAAPKFPPSALLEALLRTFERTRSPVPLDAVRRTCTAMARGGIYDQLAGGFARYSVDADWVVPHFEKMLYDNALLLRVYAHWFRRTDDPLARRITAETAAFLLADLAEDGMFTSSLDADAAGSEGSTYVWTPEQLRAALGDDDGRWAAEVFEVTDLGTFEHGSSVLQLPAASDPLPHDVERFEQVRSALLAVRRTRPQPPRDDKIITAWNGLAITALTEAAVALGDRTLLDAARRCAGAVVDLHLVDGRLRRASLGGRVGDSAAILEDHAMLATGLLALYQLDGDESWLSKATVLIDLALQHFADPDRPGCWFDTADDAEQLMVRPADPIDGATPSGAASIAEALLTAAHLVDADRAGHYREAAAATLLAHSPLLARAARSAGHWLAVAEAAVRGPLQVAVSTGDMDSELLSGARRIAPGGAIVVGGPVDSMPLLVDRDRVGGADAAYICRGTVCDLPVTTTAELAAALGVPV